MSSPEISGSSRPHTSVTLISLLNVVLSRHRRDVVLCIWTNEKLVRLRRMGFFVSSYCQITNQSSSLIDRNLLKIKLLPLKIILNETL